MNLYHYRATQLTISTPLCNNCLLHCRVLLHSHYYGQTVLTVAVLISSHGTGTRVVPMSVNRRPSPYRDPVKVKVMGETTTLVEIKTITTAVMLVTVADLPILSLYEDDYELLLQDVNWYEPDRTMESPSIGGRKRATTKSAAEDQALDQIAKDAEARLLAKRQARAEAREIRLREIERQQKEAEENADRAFDVMSDTMNRTVKIASPRALSLTHMSRRSSEDSLEGGETSQALRDMRMECKDLEEKFRKAMVQNAQLDNEKCTATYEVELLKDRFEELEETHSQLSKEHKEKCRELDQLKRLYKKVEDDLAWYKAQLEERDRLIEENGLVIVGGEQSSTSSDSGAEDSSLTLTNSKPAKRALVSAQTAQLLNLSGEGSLAKRALVSAQTAQLLNLSGEGSLDVRLKKIADERNNLLDELSHVKLELEALRSMSSNGLGNPLSELDREQEEEASKLLGDYKFKWQKAEQDVSTLQATVARLESQVIRYKSAAETSEKVEDELKVERRKLQRELREALARLEELETSNTHLQRRLDKLKNAKSNLLKDLLPLAAESITPADPSESTTSANSIPAQLNAADSSSSSTKLVLAAESTSVDSTTAAYLHESTTNANPTIPAQLNTADSSSSSTKLVLASNAESTHEAALSTQPSTFPADSKPDTKSELYTNPSEASRFDLEYDELLCADSSSDSMSSSPIGNTVYSDLKTNGDPKHVCFIKDERNQLPSEVSFALECEDFSQNTNEDSADSSYADRNLESDATDILGDIVRFEDLPDSADLNKDINSADPSQSSKNSEQNLQLGNIKLSSDVNMSGSNTDLDNADLCSHLNATSSSQDLDSADPSLGTESATSTRQVSLYLCTFIYVCICFVLHLIYECILYLAGNFQ
ncbi:hypothetical protein M8J76_014341 [Diaphorina citri]|nr:hypothetical protein M8J76_014341 [Diaphorina citri]